MQQKMKHTFELMCPLYNSTGNRFSSLLQNVALAVWSLSTKLDQQVDIGLYLAEATAVRY